MEKWRNWDAEKEYGDLFYKRATGQSPQMESAKSSAKQLKTFYKPGMRVLDAGCGAGHYLPSLQEIVDADIQYHGLDNTAYYVDLGRKAFGSEDLFTLGDVTNMPFADNEFDVVMCNNVVYHLPPQLEVPIRELLRVAKQYALIRLIVADRNYVIREILTAEDGEGLDFDSQYLPNMEDANFRYFNQYTKEYIQKVVQTVDPNVKMSLVQDSDFANFNNVDAHGMLTGTYTMQGKQVSGSLILDYHWLLLEKTV